MGGGSRFGSWGRDADRSGELTPAEDESATTAETSVLAAGCSWSTEVVVTGNQHLTIVGCGPLPAMPRRGRAGYASASANLDLVHSICTSHPAPWTARTC